MSENEKNTLIITTRFVIKNLHHLQTLFPQLVECNLLLHPKKINHYVVQPTMFRKLPTMSHYCP